jgi:hypothetical protein
MRIRYTLSMIDPVCLILQEIDKFACIEVGETSCAPDGGTRHLRAIEHVPHLTTSRWSTSVSRGGGEAGER